MESKICPGYGYWVGCKCRRCAELQEASDKSRRQDIDNFLVKIGHKTRRPKAPALTQAEAEKIVEEFLAGV